MSSLADSISRCLAAFVADALLSASLLLADGQNIAKMQKELVAAHVRRSAGGHHRRRLIPGFAKRVGKHGCVLDGVGALALLDLFPLVPLGKDNCHGNAMSAVPIDTLDV